MFSANFKSYKVLWLGCFIVNIITFFLIFHKIRPLNKTIALHYNILIGVQWYGAGKNLYSLPIIAFIMTVGNVFLYQALKNRQVVLSFLSAFMSLVIQLAFLLAAWLLIRINY